MCPFVEDHHDQIEEDRAQKDQLRKEFKKHRRIMSKVSSRGTIDIDIEREKEKEKVLQMIPQTEEDAECHLKDAENDRRFHFHRIGESDLVVRQLPNLNERTNEHSERRRRRRRRRETDGIESERIRIARIHLLIVH
jgi:hypothetical protein